VLSYTEPQVGPAMRILAILFLVFIIGSLFSALYFLIRDKGQGERAVKALTVRITLSVVLFALLMLGIYTGLITDKLQ
jgi:VIT1/CCC1 family predicted Fe2+/Mn2+ transporter